MKFKQYLEPINETSVSVLFKMAQDPKRKEEFRLAFEDVARCKIPVRITWNSPSDFANQYNKLILTKYKTEATKMYELWGKGSGGPGEMLLAYLCDDILISDKANIDLRINGGSPKYIEMKAPNWLGENGKVGTFVLGAKYAPAEKRLLQGIDKILDYIEATNPQSIKKNDWTAISKGNMNGSTIAVMSELVSLSGDHTKYDLELMKNGTVKYDKRKISNIYDKGFVKILKNLISQPSNILPFEELMRVASKEFESASTPFFFIGPKGKNHLKLVYYSELSNLRLWNIDQNGPKYAMML